MEPDQRLRVAVEATALLGQPTGVGAAVSGMLGSLVGQALELSAFAVTWRRRELLEELLPPGIGARQRSMPARPLQAIWSRSSMPSVECFIGKADVVHGTNYVVPPTRRAGRLVTVYDLTMVHFPELCHPSSLRFPALIERAVREGAHVHVTASAIGEEVTERFGISADRLHYLPLGIPELPEPSPNPNLLSAPYILAVGTAEPRKDLPGLIAAFNLLAQEHQDLRLVHVGPDGWGSEALEQAIANSPFKDRIIRTGYLDDASLARLMKEAELLAYPSIYEGFGFPPLQAMKIGTPVVASDTAVLRETIGSGGLLVPPGSPENLADAMASVLDSAAQRTALIEGGRSQAARFSWEQCGEGLSQIYAKVAQER